MRSLWILMATAFVDMIGFAMVLPLLPFYALRLGAEPWVIGPMVASFSVAQLASAPLWGRVSDRYGRRPVLLIGLAAAGVAYLVFGFANSIGLLFASRIVQGAGSGTTAVLPAYIADSTDPAHRAKGLGWLTAATSAGIMIGPAIGSLAAHLGAEAPGLVAAGLCFLNVAFAGRYLPESKPEHLHGPKRPIGAAVWQVVTAPTASAPRLVWIYTVGMGAFASMTAVFALYLNWIFEVNEKTIGWFFLYIGALSVVMRAVVLGWIVDRLGEARVMRIGAMLLAAGLALCPVPHTLPLAALVIALIPIGTALLFPCVTALLSHEAEERERGQVMGVQQAFGGAARVLGPLWATPVYQGLGPAVPFYIAAGLVLFVSLLAFQVPHRVPAPAAAAD